MDAKQCDICGGYYKSIKWNTVNKTKTRLGTSGKWTDCCPECIDKIQEVIDQRSNMSKENVK